jgi:hypothetical protein
VDADTVNICVDKHDKVSFGACSPGGGTTYHVYIDG